MVASERAVWSQASSLPTTIPVALTTAVRDTDFVTMRPRFVVPYPISSVLARTALTFARR